MNFWDNDPVVSPAAPSAPAGNTEPWKSDPPVASAQQPWANDPPVQTQKRADAPLPGLTGLDALKPEVQTESNWAQYGQMALNNPVMQHKVQDWALANNVPTANGVTPEAAGQYLQSTVTPQVIDTQSRIGEAQARTQKAVTDRDQLGTALVRQFLMNNPAATDDQMYAYVHSNLLNAGKDSSTLPPFTIDKQQRAVLTPQPEVGKVRGLLDQAAGGLVNLVKDPAEAVGRTLNTALAAGSEKLLGPESQVTQKYQQNLQNYNLGTQNIDQAVAQTLPPSTAAQQSPIYGAVEAGVGAVPSLMVLAGLGRGAALAKGGEAATQGVEAGKVIFGQVATQEFNNSYKRIYQDAVESGNDPDQAAHKAMVGGVLDSAINTFLMKFGVLGQAGSRGLRSRLAAALTSGPSQGLVSGSQETIKQLTSYAMTGKDPELERAMESTMQGTVMGTVLGGTMPHHAAETSFQAAERLNAGVDTEALTKALPESQTAPQEQTQRLLPAPKAEPLPTMLDDHTPKFRVQAEDGQSSSVALDFASDTEKALYVASHPRKGKLSAEATNWLTSQGMTPEDIQTRSAELRGRVEEHANESEESVVHIPASNADEVVNPSRRGGPAAGGEAAASLRSEENVPRLQGSLPGSGEPLAAEKGVKNVQSPDFLASNGLKHVDNLKLG
jgi:hypothetical protein